MRASVGFLATSTALYGRLTARETISLFRRLNGLAEDADRRRASASSPDELDLHEFLDRRVEKFSTGMKQKTSIARTLVHDPAVLIFDEPTVGLDVMTARNIVRFVRDCRARGKTVIYSTHVMSEVEKLCDVIGIIHHGPAGGRGIAGSTAGALSASGTWRRSSSARWEGRRRPHEPAQHAHGLSARSCATRCATAGR